FDEVRQELRGERTGIRYAIGTRVHVQVSRVDLDGRRIDFRLVREPEEGQLPAGRNRAAGAQVDTARKIKGKANRSELDDQSAESMSGTRRRKPSGSHKVTGAGSGPAARVDGAPKRARKGRR
ncbi:MAG: ribonuclease R, partial [Burkholderiaceae bacterium]